jgi:hypothetical protein
MSVPLCFFQSKAVAEEMVRIATKKQTDKIINALFLAMLVLLSRY